MDAKSSAVEDGRPSAMDLSHHFSRSSKKRLANVLKEYYRFSSLPGMGSLAGGLPYYGYFPITQLDVSVAASQPPPDFNRDTWDTSDKTIDLRINQIQDEPNMFHRIDMATALQYGIAQGFPPLYAWLRAWTNSEVHHAIPYQGKADVVICGGSADGLSKVYDLLFNEWDASTSRVEDREGLLVEEMVYTPPVSQIRHKDVNIVPVRMDAEGLIADGEGGLLDVLEDWDTAYGKQPHVLYLIPTGQNPTSGVLSLPRRKRIYEICSRFDIMIIEDDPYWNLQYGISTQTAADFLKTLVPSFLSLDVDGRVIRLDTFSKTIAPGCRLGWITAQPRICEQLIRLTDATSQQPSGISQAIVVQLLRSTWGMDGWARWLEKLQHNYRKRMVTMATIFQEGRQTQTASGPVEMFSFNWPMGGMFLWVKVELQLHPLRGAVDSERLMQALWVLCTQEPYRVLSNPGRDFAANETIRKERAHLYLRFCFASVGEGILAQKSRSFVEACQHFWTFQEPKDIDRILVDEDQRRIDLAEESERLVL